MTLRAPCVVFGCRRTFRRDAADGGTWHYICGEHYRLADKPLRALRARLKRISRREGWSLRLQKIDYWLWGRIVRQATERSIGL